MTTNWRQLHLTQSKIDDFIVSMLLALRSSHHKLLILSLKEIHFIGFKWLQSGLRGR